jgi:succinoglycan biosynthesis transport protein ExoP
MRHIPRALGPSPREPMRADQSASADVTEMRLESPRHEYFDSDDGYSPRTILAILERRKKSIIGCVCLVTLASAVVAFSLSKSYLADAMVVLDTRQEQIVAQPAVQSNVVSGSLADPAIVKSEIALLSAPAYARNVIEHLDLLHNPVFQRENAPSGWVLALHGAVNYIEMQIASLLHTTRSTQPANPMGEAITYLQRHLVVYNDERSYAINLRYSSKDPEFAALVVNTLARLYISEQGDNRAKIAQKASKFLTGRLGSLEAKARDSERRVAEFEQANHLETVLSGNVTEQRLHELNMQLLAAASDLGEKQAELRQAQDMAKSPGGAAAAAQVLSSPLIQKLREQEAIAATQTASLKDVYHNAYPGGDPRLREIDQMIAAEVQRIVLSLGADVSAAEARFALLRNAMREEQAKLDIINKARVTLVQLQHEASANRSLYDTFLTRSEQIEADEQSLQTGARFVPAEVPVNPSFPNKMLFIGFGFFGSFVLGVFLAFLAERLDETIRTPEHAADATGIPTLGVVPRVRSGDRAMAAITDAPLSAYAEAINNILVALGTAESRAGNRVVAISSAVPNEGKSLLAAALARAAATKGLRALLIDCDLRRPTISSLFTHHGSSFLDMMFKEVSTDISRFAQRDTPSGLLYLPARRMMKNLQEMLGSKWLSDLIGRARADYDLVIIDTPPLLTVSDALLLSRLSDTLLLVVRWGSTPGSLLAETVRHLRLHGDRPIGTVLSMVDMPKYLQYRRGYYSRDAVRRLTTGDAY